MIERKPVRFSKWNPVHRDRMISYVYTSPTPSPRGNPVVIRRQDRWMRVKAYIAQVAIHTGVDTFDVYGGHAVGGWAWHRIVTVTEQDAVDYFKTQIDDGAFMLKGMFRNAIAGRERRLGSDRSGDRR